MAKKAVGKSAPVSNAKANPNVTTYTIRDIPSADWQRFKEQLDGKGHKVNWAFAEMIARVGNGDIVLTK